MAFYQAKIIDDDGVQLLTLSADSSQEAKTLAAQHGRVVYCRKQSSLLNALSLSSEEREQLLTQLAFLTSSGMGTGEALRTMQSAYSARMEQVTGELLAHIESGLSLDSAMERVGPQDFPPATLALIRAGYRAGQGAEALESAASFEKELRDLKRSSGAGLTSAAFGFLGAVASTLASVFYIGPSVLSSSLIAGAGKSVDVGWALTTGYVMGGAMALMVLVIAAVLAIHFLVRIGAPAWADRVTLSIPVWRDVALARERYLAFFSVQALVAPSVSLEQAFEVSATGVSKGVLKTELEEAANAVRVGDSWASAFWSLDPIDKAALKGATDRAQLSTIFKKLAQQYRARYGRSREKLSLMLQLVAAFCLTASGGLLFATSVLPMLQATAVIL